MNNIDNTTAEDWGAHFESLTIGDVNLRVAIAGKGPLVLLVHGFPECWYSWRHQIKALSDAGYRVAAPDVRGYGGSDCPGPIEAYDMQNLTADMAALAHCLSPQEPAIIIGHDWGAPIAWNSALLYEDQFKAVAGMSVPHVPPGDVVAIDLFKRIFTDQGNFFYMVYFQDEGVAEEELEADPERSIRLFFTAIAGDALPDAWPVRKTHGQKLFDGVLEPEMPRAWFNEQDLAYYTSQFSKNGFRGPLNRYRNFHRDAVYLKQQGKTILQQPSLYLTGNRDMVRFMYPDGPVDAMKNFVSQSHKAIVLDHCGHWTQQEFPADVSRHLLDWLATIN